MHEIYGSDFRLIDDHGIKLSSVGQCLMFAFGLAHRDPTYCFFLYKKIGYNINVLQQTACLVVNPITVGNFAFLFNCTPVGRTSDSMMVLT